MSLRFLSRYPLLYIPLYRMAFQELFISTVSVASHHIYSLFHSRLGYIFPSSLHLKAIYSKVPNDVSTVKKKTSFLFSFHLPLINIRGVDHTLLEILSSFNFQDTISFWFVSEIFYHTFSGFFVCSFS